MIAKMIAVGQPELPDLDPFADVDYRADHGRA